MQEHNVPVDIFVILYCSNSNHANFLKALQQACQQGADYKDQSQQMPAKIELLGNKRLETQNGKNVTRQIIFEK